MPKWHVFSLDSMDLQQGAEVQTHQIDSWLQSQEYGLHHEIVCRQWFCSPWYHFERTRNDGYISRIREGWKKMYINPDLLYENCYRLQQTKQRNSFGPLDHIKCLRITSSEASSNVTFNIGKRTSLIKRTPAS
jgi:hypothetical protein